LKGSNFFQLVKTSLRRQKAAFLYAASFFLLLEHPTKIGDPPSLRASTFPRYSHKTRSRWENVCPSPY